MIVVDTTVLAYAVGDTHPLREPCRRLLAAHADGRIEATTTVEVIQAFDAVLAAVAIGRRADALVSADRAFAAIPGLTLIDPATPAMRRLIGD